MELRATIGLGGGRGGQLGEEDSPFIVKEQIQLLSTYSARDERYYRTQQAVLPHEPMVLPQGPVILSLARQELTQAYGKEAEGGRNAGAVLPLPLAVLLQGRVGLDWEGMDI